MAAKKRSRRTRKSNIRRCPLLKVTTEEMALDEEGKPTDVKVTTQEFNDCYKSFCMAWNGRGCSYFDVVVEASGDEEPLE